MAPCMALSGQVTAQSLIDELQLAPPMLVTRQKKPGQSHHFGFAEIACRMLTP